MSIPRLGRTSTASQWPEAEAFMRNLNLGLTRFEYMKLGQYALGTNVPLSYVNDGAIEGGGETGSAGANIGFGSSLFQTPKTGKWAFTIRTRLKGPTSGRISQVGVINAAGTHLVSIATDFALDQTHYVIRIVGGATVGQAGTLAADAAIHTVTMAGDGTNVKSYFDFTQTADATLATSNMSSDEPMSPFIFNTTAGDAVLSRFAYGYIDP